MLVHPDVSIEPAEYKLFLETLDPLSNQITSSYELTIEVELQDPNLCTIKEKAVEYEGEIFQCGVSPATIKSL